MSHLMPPPCCLPSKAYGITIRELDQPLLIHRPREKQTPEGKVSRSQRAAGGRLRPAVFSRLLQPLTYLLPGGQGLAAPSGG